MLFLNNKKLSPFLHQDLEYLNLRYSLVKADMVETISSHCPSLQKLYLSWCDQLKAVESWGLVFSESLIFSQLEIFHVERCCNLKRLKINAPKLQVLKANNNTKLNDLKMLGSCLHLDLRHSLVKEDMIEEISCNCPSLQKLYLSECDQLQAVEIWGLIFSKPLIFPKLEIFHIDRCCNLKRLRINAPKLRVLKANNNVNLNDLNMLESCSKS